MRKPSNTALAFRRGYGSVPPLKKLEGLAQMTLRAKNHIDQKWFHDRLNDLGYSLRGFAKIVDINYAALSRRFSGDYDISLKEAALFARLLGVTFEEIVRRAGIDIPRDSKSAVKVVGVVNGGGRIVNGHGRFAATVARPEALPRDVVALRGVNGGPGGGWIYYFNPSQKLSSEAIGRLAVVNEGVVGVLERGSDRGSWRVTPPFGEGSEGVKVRVATPVLMVVP